MQRRIKQLVLKVAPPVVAFVGVAHGTGLSAWTSRHETTLLLILFALVGSLVHPQLRNIVITSLCYGVSFLAARDMYIPLVLTGMRSEAWYHVRMAVLFTIAILTLSAALAESFRPGTVWGRRCYFGGAGLYFLGTGAINYHGAQSWQSIMMIITGLAATAGCIFAHKIVELEKEDAADTPANDLAVAESTHTAHVQALKAKEWHDPLESQSP